MNIAATFRDVLSQFDQLQVELARLKENGETQRVSAEALRGANETLRSQCDALRAANADLTAKLVAAETESVRLRERVASAEKKASAAMIVAAEQTDEANYARARLRELSSLSAQAVSALAPFAKVGREMPDTPASACAYFHPTLPGAAFLRAKHAHEECGREVENILSLQEVGP